MPANRERLRKLIEDNCLLEGPEFTLSTGEKSRFYFDCKGATLHGEGLTLIAQEFLAEIENLAEKPTAIGGLTMGADFLAAAVIILSHQKGGSILHGSIVRKEPKKHGTQNRIENQLAAGTKIIVVDDVITTGSATLKACQEFETAGYEIVGVLAVVDRQAGGKEQLEARYQFVRTIFKKSDFSISAASRSKAADRTAA